MTNVLSFFQGRLPQKTAADRVVGRGLSTHPSALPAAAAGELGPGSRLGFVVALAGPAIAQELANEQRRAEASVNSASFHDRLHAAWQEEGVDGFVRVAAEFYRNGAVLSLADLHPLSQDAHALFAQMGPALNPAPVERFFNRLKDADLTEYFQGPFWRDVGRVNDTVLGLEALRLHGVPGAVDHPFLLKALYGVRLAQALRAREERRAKVAPLKQLFQLRVLVPGWVWHVDPCHDAIAAGPAKPNSPAAAGRPARPGASVDGRVAPELASSPLINQLVAVADHRAALKEAPNEALCECSCEESCVPQNPCCVQIQSLVTDLLVVREDLHSYEARDVAQIENVMAGESMTRIHQSLLQVEQTQQTETVTNSSQERDHQVSERFELNSAVQKTVDEDRSVDAGVTVNQDWGTGNATATVNGAYSLSKSSAEQAARNYARDVVDRSVSKIEQNVRELSSRRVLSQTRETNKHVFDRVGQDLTVGIYHWVNKKTKAQVFGYGRRMIYELYLPEPALPYQALLAKAYGLDATFALAAPVKPVGAKEITPANYLALVNAAGVEDAPPPPAATKTLVQPVGAIYGQPAKVWWKAQEFTGMKTQTVTVGVPDGYVATNLSGEGDVEWNGGTDTSSVVVRLGGTNLQWQHVGADIVTTPLPGLEGTLQLVADAYNITSFSLQLTVQCTLKPEVLLSWQQAVYQLLVKAYAKEQEAYDAAKTAFEADQAAKRAEMADTIRNRNPFFNREIERQALKQAAIAMLSCQHFDRFNAMKRRVRPCGLPQMDLPEAVEQGKIIRFWEQAIDWNLMTYLFYPSFWSPKCSWADKVKTDTGDGLFDKFMQAGAARVEFPVREGFEDLMLYWEKTGQIWGKEGEPPLSDSDTHWLSMVEEIKHQQDCFQNDREGRVDVAPPSADILLHGSDRYWDPGPGPGPGTVDDAAIAADRDREIFIEAVVYRIVDIVPDPNSLPFDPGDPDRMSWIVTLDRPYAGVAATGLHYAVGALYVGAPWFVTVPTNLVWLANKTCCLPEYPLPPCGG